MFTMKRILLSYMENRKADWGGSRIEIVTVLRKRWKEGGGLKERKKE